LCLSVSESSPSLVVERRIDKATLAKTPRWSAGDRWSDEEEGVEDILEVETVDLGRLEGE
jgi:hypothetical protein